MTKSKKSTIKYLGDNYEYIKVKRVIRNIVPGRQDWLGGFGLLVGEATIGGRKCASMPI